MDWYSCVRDVCAQYFTLLSLEARVGRSPCCHGRPGCGGHPAVMGGQGVEVEIESKFGKREFNRGSVVDGR